MSKRFEDEEDKISELSFFENILKFILFLFLSSEFDLSEVLFIEFKKKEGFFVFLIEYNLFFLVLTFFILFKQFFCLLLIFYIDLYAVDKRDELLLLFFLFNLDNLFLIIFSIL